MAKISKKPVQHDHLAWAKEYNSKGPGPKKTMRAKIGAQAIQAAKNGYMLKGHKIELSDSDTKAMKAGTKVFDKPKDHFTHARTKKPTEIKVYNDDTINIARKFQKKGLKPVALNLGNAKRPGGGWRSGAAAQEESLFRRSNYYRSLCPWANKNLKNQMSGGKYKIPEFGCVYTPKVTVFRKDEKNGYKLQKPFKVDFIANAAYKLGKKTPSNYESKMKSKIRAVLRVADGTGHDSVVLGASGCGAFKNDPKVVSRLFKEVLSEPEFKRGQFKKIAFAIFDDHNSKGNYAQFKKNFH